MQYVWNFIVITNLDLDILKQLHAFAALFFHEIEPVYVLGCNRAVVLSRKQDYQFLKKKMEEKALMEKAKRNVVNCSKQ